MKQVKNLVSKTLRKVVILKMKNGKDFLVELEHLINRYSIDSYLNMHDFNIAQLIVSNIESLRNANVLEYELKRMDD
jgi:hypothetical protein